MRQLLLVSGLLACAGSACAAPRTAFQVRCEDTISKTVTVLTTRQSGYSINNALSYKQLTQMKGADRLNSYVLGLTKTESRVSVALDGPILQDKSTGYECVAPQLAVNLFYTPITIYVGREFQPGTCAYRAILAHEMRHLTTYLEHLPKVEALVRAALEKRFENKPLYAPSGQARDLLAQEIDNGWMPYIKGEMGKVELLQAAIDTQDEYDRLSTICQGEVQSVLGQGQRKKR